jgi:hypothetical protein
MKSMQMKALALAVLGLAGMGSAMAACTNTTPFAAWSSSISGGANSSGAQLGGTTVATTGLHSTSCAMAASFTHAAPSSNGEEAVVFDNSPNFEQTYRFRFYVDPTAVKSSLSTLNTMSVFAAKSQLAHGSGTPTQQGIVQMYLVGGGGNVNLRTYAACSSGDNFLANRCRAASDISLGAVATDFTAGIRIEGQVILGAAGTGKVNIWVGSNTNSAAPDATINVDNSAWYAAGSEGVKQAVMGMFQGSTPFRNATQNMAVLFDEFDSRRQTFIGL